MEGRKRISEKEFDLGRYFVEVDINNVYITYEYPIEKACLMAEVANAYTKNGGALELKNDEDKGIITALACVYSTFISIDDSVSVFSDVYNNIEKMQELGGLDKGEPTMEIVNGLLSPSIKQKDNILAWRWCKCDNDWWLNNILEYVEDEFKGDFARMVGFQRLFVGNNLTTKDLYKALVDIMRIDSETKEKHTYIFKDTTGLYMVGHSKEIPIRFKAIKQGNTTLKVVAELKGDFTRQIHKEFSNKRVEGIWFKLNNNDLSYIKALK